ncbi:MAG: NFACT RNA binding domain-containing protein [Melioribacteraceae bacterium]
MNLIRNYFYLIRCTQELNVRLSGLTIEDIFSQEKDVIFLHVPNEQYDNQHFLFSAVSNDNYFLIKPNHRKAKKNFAKLFNEIFPLNIESFSIAEYDRIIKLQTNVGSFYFVLRGNSSNVFYITPNLTLSSFKKFEIENEDKIVSELTGLNYISEINLSSLNPKAYNNSVIKPFQQEAEIRNIPIDKIISEVLTEEISFAKFSINDSLFCPKTFSIVNQFDGYNTSSNYLEASDQYRTNAFHSDKKEINRRILTTAISKRLERVSNKINELTVRVEKKSRDEYYNKLGNILLSNIHTLQKGIDKIELFDFYENKECTIKLDSKKSPKENIDDYFTRSKSEKINYVKSIELLDTLKNEFHKLKTIFESIEDLDIDKMDDLIKRMKLMTEQKENDNNNLQDSFRHFLVENKYHVFVGKDNKNNDLLTTKFAKQNDYWFHARSVPGSHVVLRIDNLKENPPKNILKAVASIAAFYSKAKTASLAPVSYTQKKYVRKNKNMSIGEVALLKEEVLLVKPEIPANSEHYDNNEL